EHLAKYRRAGTGDQLDRLTGHQGTHLPAQGPEYPALGTGRDTSRWWRSGEEIAQRAWLHALRRPGPEHRDLSVGAEDRGPDERDTQFGAGIVDHVAGGEVVRAVEHEVVTAQ